MRRLRLLQAVAASLIVLAFVFSAGLLAVQPRLFPWEPGYASWHRIDDVSIAGSMLAVSVATVLFAHVFVAKRQLRRRRNGR